MREEVAAVMREELDAFTSRGHKIPLFHASDHFADLGANARVYAATNESAVWGSIFLKIYGAETDLGRRYFPRSLAAVRRSPLSTAMLSVVDPGRAIEWHKGFFNGILRYHLGIVVPPDVDGDGPRMLIDTSTSRGSSRAERSTVEVRWTEGGDFLFDDTFEHSVRNPTAARRVVLFADVVRHDCPRLLAALLHALVHHVLKHTSPMVADIAEVSDAYAARYTRRDRRRATERGHA